MSPDTALVLDPEGRDHYGEARALRKRGPIARVKLPDGIDAWVVTAPALIRTLTTHSHVSKDPLRHWPIFRDGRIGPEWPLGTFVLNTNMFTTDGEAHRRLRTLAAPAFTQRQVERTRPLIEQAVTTALNDLDASRDDADPVDLRERFAHPVPLDVLTRLLGVPADVAPRLRVAVEGIFATAATAEERLTTHQLMQSTLHELVRLKRATPGDDVISALIAAHDDETGSGLSETELIATLLLLIGAGHETTTNLLGNAIAALLSHPEQLAQVLAGDVTWQRVIEETLRWHAPIANVPMYFATARIDVGSGVVLQPGDAIMLNVAAAGRHPGVNGHDADRFDLTRSSSEHLSFGHGPHFCLGAALARLEAGIALPALFAAFPHLALAVPPAALRPQASLVANGLRTLPVYLDARQQRP